MAKKSKYYHYVHQLFESELKILKTFYERHKYLSQALKQTLRIVNATEPFKKFCLACKSNMQHTGIKLIPL